MKRAALIRSSFAWAILFAAVMAPASAAENCALVRLAKLDMQLDDHGGIYVPMTIAGQNANLLIDTGGIVSMLTQSLVAKLGLPTQRIEGARVTMFGGTPITSYVTAHDVEFGRLKAEQLKFMVVPDERLGEPLNGTLAPDIMNAYDDEFDFANARFSLFSSDHCVLNLAYWTSGPHAEIPFSVDRTGHIEFEVTLDGNKILATLDTGSSRSLLDLDRAEYLYGFNEKDPSLTSAGDARTVRIYRYPFKSLTFGDETSGLGSVKTINPDLMLMSNADARLPDTKEMILGMGILRQLHMYFAHKEKKLYVTAASAH